MLRAAVVDALTMTPWSDPESEECEDGLAVEEVAVVEVGVEGDVELYEILELWAALGAEGNLGVGPGPLVLAQRKRCVNQTEKMPAVGQLPQFWWWVGAMVQLGAGLRMPRTRNVLSAMLLVQLFLPVHVSR